MTYPAPEGDRLIRRVHNVALCTEIAERLGASLDRMPAELPAHLVLLMAQFRSEGSGVQPDPNP